MALAGEDTDLTEMNILLFKPFHQLAVSVTLFNVRHWPKWTLRIHVGLGIVVNVSFTWHFKTCEEFFIMAKMLRLCQIHKLRSLDSSPHTRSPSLLFYEWITHFLSVANWYYYLSVLFLNPIPWTVWHQQHQQNKHREKCLAFYSRCSHQ